MPGFLSRSLNAAAMWLADDDGNALGTAANPLRTTGGGTGTNANQVQGTSAAGASDDASNPVKAGGVDAGGVRRAFRLASSGAVTVGQGFNGTDGAGNTQTFAYADTGAGNFLATVSWVFNGATWDRQRGDTTGTWTVPGLLPAATDRSGTATTGSNTLAAANASRRGLNIQNIGANNIGVNEFGGTAAIGTAGTYTLAPGASMNIRTNRAVTVIAATASTAYSATEF